MTWEDALEMVVGQTRHEAYRQLAHESHPDHEKWREWIIGKAMGQADEAIAAAGTGPARDGCCGGAATSSGTPTPQ